MRSFFRFLCKYKALTIIQIVSVSVALSFGIPLVSTFAEFSWMKYDNPRYKDIYGVNCGLGAMSFPQEDLHFLNNYPEVEHAMMIVAPGHGVTERVICDEGDITAHVMYCSGEMQEFFPVNMVRGTLESVSAPGSILISQSLAEKLSSGDMMGRSVRLGDGKEYTVSGIFDGFSSRRIQPTDIIRSEGIKGYEFFANTFLMLKPGTDIEAFTAKVRGDNDESFNDLVRRMGGGDLKSKVSFERYDKMVSSGNFYGFNSMNKAFAIIGVLSLLLFLFAFFNYSNLSVAMATRRAKEFATMRLLGSSRSQVRNRIILETITFTAICFVFGLLISGLSSNLMRKLFVLADTDVLEHLAFSPVAIAGYILLIVLVGLLFGLAPARVITGYSAIDVVKGEFKAREKGFWSKVLIFLQFATVVCLVFITLDQVRQLRMSETADIGCDVDDVFVVKARWNDPDGEDLIMDALRNKPYVQHIGLADNIPGFVNSYLANCRNMFLSRLICDEEAFQAFGFGKVEDYHADGAKVGWLTLTTYNILGGEPLSIEEMEEMGVDCIGGVIEPFKDATKKISPYVVVTDDVPDRNIIISIVGDHAAVQEDIKSTVSQIMKERCGYVNLALCDFHRALLNRDNETSGNVIELLKGYSWVMLLLSVLGILGIGLYGTYIHKHDIAVRKAFGATSAQETGRNSRGFIILMAIANVVGLPLGYMISDSMKRVYLVKFPTEISTFVITFAFTMLCVAAVIYALSFFAARENPIDSLKTE